MRAWVLPIVLAVLVVAAIAYFGATGNRIETSATTVESSTPEPSDGPAFDPANFVVPPGARRVLMKQPCYDSAILWDLRRTLLEKPGLLDVDVAGGWLIVVFEDEAIKFGDILGILEEIGCPMSKMVYDKRGRSRSQE